MTDFVQARGNLLKMEVDALVNTVNTVGVMGKGIALQFKKAFPQNFKAYEKACKQGRVEIGSVFVYDHGAVAQPQFIINFPTKEHWRSNSRLEHISRGLDDLAVKIRELKIGSIAIPPLGCGNGGLDWSDVEPLIRQKLAGLDVVAHIFSPAGVPEARAMPDARERPTLTPGRAALIRLLERYSALALGVSVIEIQKLMYFLQEAGQPLRLRYTKGRYGPYADNLRHVLVRLEGHQLDGYGDGSKAVRDADPIQLRPGAADEASHFLADLDDPDLAARLDRTLSLVEGFESSYGLELLATVHWCAKNELDVDSAEDAASCVRSWNARKGELFTDTHVAVAWDRLVTAEWL